MEKLLIIPDVHGRTFWRDPCKDLSSYSKVIFLGDYVDCYSYEGVTRVQERQGLIDIIDFKKSNQDKVVLLIGNHDYQYITGDGCSRFSRTLYPEYHNLFLSNLDLFSLYHVEGNYLFSHSGILSDWLKTNDLKLEDITLELRNQVIDPLNQVSSYRGGLDNYGSCIWADVREFLSRTNENKSGYFQIFGHTQLIEDPLVYKDKKVADLDCRQAFILENNILTEYGTKRTFPLC